LGGRSPLRLLLDTHIWLWSLLEPEQLRPRLRRRVEDPATELWLSPISAWEAALLAERGRIEVTGQPVEWVRARYGRCRFATHRSRGKSRS